MSVAGCARLDFGHFCIFRWYSDFAEGLTRKSSFFGLKARNGGLGSGQSDFSGFFVWAIFWGGWSRRFGFGDFWVFGVSKRCFKVSVWGCICRTCWPGGVWLWGFVGMIGACVYGKIVVAAISGFYSLQNYCCRRRNSFGLCWSNYAWFWQISSIFSLFFYPIS